jgi:hypothetical protein
LHELLGISSLNGLGQGRRLTPKKRAEKNKKIPAGDLVHPIDLMKRVAFRHTALGKPKYPFNIEPVQLATLVLEIDRLRDTVGAIVEVGVARGMTTRFVCEHLIRRGCTHQELYAIDTFRSFLKTDIDYEVTQVTPRGEAWGKELKRMFAYNDFEAWKRNFNDFPFVKAIQSDCATFDFATIAPIKLAFLDVDLYLPTKRALPRIYEHVCDGGTIMIDDVEGDDIGACRAYMEFCEELKVSPTVVGNRCGIIRK